MKNLLRISTAGSVDDGKSTLIGRLLHDCQSIMTDQMHQLSTQGQGDLNFAALTDGLKSEREQGITIDVAYKYFASPRRKFILADTPGHEQYTRNMATGASTADLAIILVDARQGPTEQTKRHTAISHLLKIPLVIFAINKMDSIAYDEDRYLEIEQQVLAMAQKLGFAESLALPMSALKGDNITKQSTAMPWYRGPSLLEHLETLDVSPSRDSHGHLAVQYVIRPHQDFRGFAGKVTDGTLREGDFIEVFPEDGRSRIKAIYRGNQRQGEAREGQSILVELEENLDIQAGSIISHVDNPIQESYAWQSSLVWFAAHEAQEGRTYLLKHRSRYFKVRLSKLLSKLNLSTLQTQATRGLSLNDIGQCVIESQATIGASSYESSRLLGSFLLVDEQTYATVAAGRFEFPIELPKSQRELVWHFIDSQNSELFKSLIQESNTLLIDNSPLPGSPEIDLWWLKQISKSNIPVVTNRRELLDYSEGVLWREWSENDLQRLRRLLLSGGSLS
ncbi:sulfate adenylyltransferase subunit 1 [Pseudobacteriovorax antillogorgiicola]|uniref:sulfate adenylyltransferase n=1 Tax=Pseudobacteriovorax antillogorgiicola TaxID=1513793 RepID=A0A1Y6CNS0_9BACT|nr:GTP-binding protein [Pseudobacteriovorax antillogorgiicola]TCS44590.1 sulfate adenylyltransferase large subunit [Pseudobacteriovorax antillogorgiicola]SMF78086.1 sulfate adenylyltransferase, large subunit [Pseudobacteriovorax antillogorgiicola]